MDNISEMIMINADLEPNGTTGTAVPYASTTNALAGRVAVTAGASAVTTFADKRFHD